MPYYRVDFRHTQVGLRGLLADSESYDSEALFPRLVEAENAMESVGGRVLHLFYAFGTSDGFAIVEAPDDVALAGAVLAVEAAGGVELSTTVLLTPEEFMAALAQARKVKYRPPGPRSGKKNNG